MSSWHRRNQVGKSNEDGHNDLLVFGYSSRIFPSDDQSDFISEERHMVQCLGDPTNRVDRYDCRLLLSSVDNLIGKYEKEEEDCPTEAMEEDMCEEERYLDMYKDMKEQKDREEEEERRRQSSSKATIGFDYGTGTATGKTETFEEESDSEDEPFEPPEGIKFPVGLITPQNMKLHHIIERTASFVVANGAQMEIVIKAKQRNNAEQFGFLDFDHQLYPFYKYIQKLIREKKYVPDLNKKIKKKPEEKPTSSALAAIAKNHASDSDSGSDSDCELHPSLLAGISKTNTMKKGSVIGPKSKPEPIIPQNTKDISQRNDVYASLFKNIAHVTREVQGVQEISSPGMMKKKAEHINDPEGRQDDPEYRDWYEKFYHYPCPWIGPKPMLPPTPDVEPVVNSYAEYVARKGVQFEKSLASRSDLQLHFMDPKSPYYSYYHHRIRMFQWQMTQEYNNYKNSLAVVQSTNSTSSTGNEHSKTPSASAPSLLDLTIPPPNYDTEPKSVKEETDEQQNLNRKQRRRLLEVNRTVGTVSEPGVIDPIAMRKSVKLEEKDDDKMEDGISLVGKIQPFTVNKIEEKSLASSVLEIDAIPSTSVAYDPDLGDIVSPVKEEVQESGIDELEPPAPPAIPNNTQLDRKEKARIFMEKLLQEKKLKKQREEEEERRKIKQEEERARIEAAGPVKVKTIDEIINSRISSLLSESGFEKEKPKKEKEESENSDRKRKKHRKRSRSRSRSDISDTEHKKSRKSSHHHHHRRRSRSRSRSRSRRDRR